MDKSWQPYSKDCSLGYCSYYCPQWCFFLFPPPPPPSPSHPLLSPLLIAVIAVVSTAFLILAYYLILAHYRRSPTITRPLDNPPPGPWHAGRDGLDDTLINKISACQYRAGSGLVFDGADCSVCLSPFEDGDRIRLLPKCHHPFHVSCIDTWLKSHSSCPLCRASIFPVSDNNNTRQVVVSEPEPELELPDTTTSQHVSHDIIEIREERGVIRRSLSMDHSSSVGRRTDTDTNTDTDTGMSRWARVKRSMSLRNTLPT